MSDVRLNSIKFPTLPNRYVVKDYDATIEELRQYIYSFFPQKSLPSAPLHAFSDGADGIPIKAMSVDVSAVQDTNGYGYPWVAGGGVNKWPFADPSYTGTKTYSFDTPIMKANQTYTISANLSIDNPSYTTAIIFYWYSGESGYAGNLSFSEGQTSKTFTPTTDVIALNFYATDSGSTNPGVTTTWSNFQIELGSSATSYAPYSNYCPISARSSASVVWEGKNLWSIGDLTTASQSGVGLLLKAGQYTMQGVRSNASLNLSVRFNYVGGDSVVVSLANSTDFSGKTFTLTNDVVSVNYSIANFSTGASISNIQIELGSSASAFEAYNGHIVTMQFGSSTYGGVLEYVDGKEWRFTPTHGYKTLNGTAADGEYSRISTGRFNVDNIGVAFLHESNASSGISTNYPSIKQTGSNSDFDTAAANYGCAYNLSSNTSTQTLRIKDGRFDTVDDLKAEFATNNLTIVFELATPLDPITITASDDSYTLYGGNTVYADCGDSSLTYRQDIGLLLNE